MRRYGRMAVGLAGLLVLGAAGAAEYPVAPFASVQVSRQGSKPPTPRTISFCRDGQSLNPDSAFNAFTPLSVEFLRKIGRPRVETRAEAQRYAVTLLERPRHGEVRLTREWSHSWIYLPAEGYTGADRVTYLVETDGKRYRVVINFWVVEAIQEGAGAEGCESIDFGRPHGTDTTTPALDAVAASTIGAPLVPGSHRLYRQAALLRPAATTVGTPGPGNSGGGLLRFLQRTTPELPGPGARHRDRHLRFAGADRMHAGRHLLHNAWLFAACACRCVAYG